MPFDFKAYDAKCAGLTPQELQKEWEHYTRLITGGATSTAISGLAIPLTAGISTIGVALAAPGLHNSRRKREIIERHLQRHGTTHETRKRDVLGSMAFSGTVGVVTLGVGSAGADSIVQSGAEHGLVLCDTAVKVVTHVAMDGYGMALEHAHTTQQRKKEAQVAFANAGVFQAVADAKAQEAGYSIDPHHQQQNQQQMQTQYYAAGPSSAGAAESVAMAMAMPPPMYAPHDPLQPVPAPPGYASASVGGHSRVVAEKQPERAPQQVHDPYQQYYQTQTSVASTAYNEKYQGPPTQIVSQVVAPGPQGLQDHGRQPVQPVQTQPASLPSAPVHVFEMSALEQALPQHYPASISQHWEHGSASAQILTPATTGTTVTSALTPQTMHSQMTRSSTMISACSTASQVQPGYCPTPQPQQLYQPPPPPPLAVSQQSPGLQQQAVPSPAPQVNVSHNAVLGQPDNRLSYQLQHQQYLQTGTSTTTPSQTHYQQLPVPAVYDPARSSSPSSYSYIPSAVPSPGVTHQTSQRPASMYFAPPPEQATATGPAKGKRMSMMSMATNKLASGLSSAAGALENYAQKQPSPPEAQGTAAHSVAGVAAQARLQATPQQYQNVHTPAQGQTIGSLQQQQYLQQLQLQQQQQQQKQQQYIVHKPVPTGPGTLQQFPPTPLSLPTSPMQMQGGQQYQPQYAQQIPAQGTGYFPPPSPQPLAQHFQAPQYAQQAPSSHPPGPHGGYGYQQPGMAVPVGYGGVLTPMATPHLV